MKDLEQYIRDNAEAFDIEELPSGHFERFEAKLASAERPRIRWRRLAEGISAAIAVLLIVGSQSGKLWMSATGNDPANVYKAYAQRTASLYGKVLAKDYDGSRENSFLSVADEAIPLIDQLPDELDDATKASILREYYGTLLEGSLKVSKSR